MHGVTADIRRLCDLAISAAATLRCCRPNDALIEPLETIAEALKVTNSLPLPQPNDAREALIKALTPLFADDNDDGSTRAEIVADSMEQWSIAANLALIPAAELAELRGQVKYLQSRFGDADLRARRATEVIVRIREKSGLEDDARYAMIYSWIEARKADKAAFDGAIKALQDALTSAGDALRDQEAELARLRKMAEYADSYEFGADRMDDRSCFMRGHGEGFEVGGWDTDADATYRVIYHGTDRAAAESAFLAAVAEIEGGEKE